MPNADLDFVDVEALTGWLDEHVPSVGNGPLEMSLVSGGTTNLVVRIDRGGDPAVLRSPPRIASPQGAKTIAREATVLRALTGTDVPHPAFHGNCDDPAVMGVPFYVMDMVEGWAATITEDNETLYPEGFDHGADQHYLGYAMIDGLAAMAKVDYLAVGLGDFGKPVGFLDRQVDRWLGQLASYPKIYPKYQPREIEGLDYVADWLRGNTPSTSTPGLMHGDYALNNVLFANRPPARLVAIIDWETATIGDPLLDAAGFLQSLVSVRTGEASFNYFDPTNFPTREDGEAYYGELTGLDMSAMPYYYVLTRFRTACMIEYKVAEAVQGLAPKEKGDRFDAMVRRLILAARDLVKTLD